MTGVQTCALPISLWHAAHWRYSAGCTTGCGTLDFGLAAANGELIDKEHATATIDSAGIHIKAVLRFALIRTICDLPFIFSAEPQPLIDYSNTFDIIGSDGPRYYIFWHLY